VLIFPLSVEITKCNARFRLLTVDPAVFRKPTINKLVALHDNYVAHVETAENSNAQEKREENDFLNAVMNTRIMRKAETFLREKNFLSRRSGNRNYNLKDKLAEIWFTMYPRMGNTVSSSGFEHVFLGEIKNDQVSGLHSWVFFHKEESSRRLDYKGRIGRTISLGNVSFDPSF